MKVPFIEHVNKIVIQSLYENILLEINSASIPCKLSFTLPRERNQFQQFSLQSAHQMDYQMAL
jgi:hypothetical protein